MCNYGCVLACAHVCMHAGTCPADHLINETGRSHHSQPAHCPTDCSRRTVRDRRPAHMRAPPPRAHTTESGRRHRGQMPPRVITHRRRECDSQPAPHNLMLRTSPRCSNGCCRCNPKGLHRQQPFKHRGDARNIKLCGAGCESHARRRRVINYSRRRAPAVAMTRSHLPLVHCPASPQTRHPHPR